MNKLLKEKIEQFKQDVINDENLLRTFRESIKNAQIDIEAVEKRIQQTQEVIDKLSK